MTRSLRTQAVSANFLAFPSLQQHELRAFSGHLVDGEARDWLGDQRGQRQTVEGPPGSPT